MNPKRTIARGALATLLMSATLLMGTALLTGTAACTADALPPADALPHTQPGGTVVTSMAAKPAYAPSTRTATDTGAWQTGDLVTATIYLYSDDYGKNNVQGSPKEQKLTYAAGTPATDTTPATPGKWNAEPDGVPILRVVRSMRVTYSYMGLLDPLSNTREQISGYVSKATGTAIGTTTGTPGIGTFTPSTTNDRLIPILNPEGTLTLTAAFQRQTALVAVTLAPHEEAELSTAYTQPGVPLQIDLYYLTASNTTDLPATAYFHLLAPTQAQANDDYATATAANFRLGIKDMTQTAYPKVPFRTGWLYALSTEDINPGPPITPGTGGDDKQK